jgi:secondary thiamine-phosphate synthase enzyme
VWYRLPALFAGKKLPMRVVQKQIELRPVARGCHLITDQVEAGISGLAQFASGLCHIFIKHTSASLTVNENADPAVRRDMEAALNHLVPEDLPFEHKDEGPDDMPAHVKASLMGSGVLVPVINGRLGLGTWQGIYLNEHRDRGGARSLVVTIFGV